MYRVDWSAAEDSFLLLCKVAGMFLCAKTRSAGFLVVLVFASFIIGSYLHCNENLLYVFLF
jgi:hypothetical protein